MHKRLACSKVPTRGKMECLSAKAWETVQSHGERSYEKLKCQRVGKQQLEPGTAPKEPVDSIATVFQEMIASEDKREV